VSTQDPVAALTFDDGPHPVFTIRLLEILESYHARATFFMVGNAARRHPELVRRVAEAGHAIGNHSWDHPSFPLISARKRREQIRACSKALAPYEQCLFRPPFGHQNVWSRLDALWLGYRVVTWNLVAVDWLDRDAESIAGGIVSQIRPGSVILFHDSLYMILEERYANREPTLEAVRLVLDRVGNYFRFVTVPELLRHGRPRQENWYRMGRAEFLNRLRNQEARSCEHAPGRRGKRLTDG
jgi:peptidoglycan/xylan/chitin deacetylase (PgdA/CDA1 family)